MTSTTDAGTPAPARNRSEPDRPRLRADYQAVRVADSDGDLLLCVGETRTVLVESPAAADLADLLDGHRTAAALIGALADRHPAAEVARALRRLRALGLLAHGDSRRPRGEIAAWDARGVDPDQAAAILSEPVELINLDATTVAALIGGLQRSGLRVSTLSRVDFEGRARVGVKPRTMPIIVVVGQLTDPRLGPINQYCLSVRQPYLLVRPQGSVLLLGPHIVPGETGCWECLRQRWTANDQVGAFLAQRTPRTADRAAPAFPAPAFLAHAADPAPAFLAHAADPAHATDPALASFAVAVAGLLAAELPVLAQRGRSDRLTGTMVALDTRDLSSTRHRLTRLPQCPACGDPEVLIKAGPRVQLTSARLTDGRTRTLAATEQAIDHEVSRYLGVVTRLADTSDAESGHSFRASHQFPSPRDVRGLRESLRGYSGGTGRTAQQARVAAIAEAIERYCGVWRGDRTTQRATASELGSDRAIPLDRLLHFSERQYVERDRVNPGVSHFNRVPRPSSVDTVLEWSTAWSLTHERPREVPAAYCWYGHPDQAAVGVCAADSNGCAAGNTLAEAVVRGFCELVERDSVALWWYHRSRRPGVDLDSFDDAWIAAAAHRHARLGRELWALDLTADLPVPAYAAISQCSEDQGEVLVGFGADLDPSLAIGRALSEVDQFLPIVRTAGASSQGADAARWFQSVRATKERWLRPDGDQALSTMDAHRPQGTGDAATDAVRCAELAAAAGLEVMVLDQSRPDIDLAVARVIVPGLRHFWRRLGPGRLWEVPAKLGRLPRAPDESAVNPLNVFF